MKKSLIFFGLFCAWIPFCREACAAKALHPAAASPALTRLKSRIDGLVHKGLDAGVAVASLDTGELLYERNADEPLIPASTNKLFTAFTAFKKLRPIYTFKTNVYVTGPIRDGKLAGDLYIKGGGDPSLVSERLWMLVNELIRSGIRTVSGNLIVDSSYFDKENVPDSRPKYLKDQAYNSPVGAFSFNFNTTTIYVKPGESAGHPPVVYTDPENSYIDVVNQATTGKAGSKNTIVVSRTDFVKGDIGDTVLLRGNIPLDHKEMRFYKNIVNPALYSAHMFKTFYEQRGAKFLGNVMEGQVPGSARQILEFESQPLWQIVWGMNKFSNNFVADMLMKDIGAEMFGTPGTLAKGISAVEEALEDIGIPKNSYKIVDGSGLTRNTHVTTRQLLTLLVSAYHDFSMGPEFLASLGIAGEDGTLRHRFTKGNLTGLLRAKTGTLDGVSSLAGFAPNADGEMLAFSIILNDPRGKYGRMTAWVDEIALAISKFSRKS
jgi:D-alanyl-D-alanine carboxypeptidase/D-alanyl-D-alanine-endopeptidase (penicillin-binding protein 4)